MELKRKGSRKSDNGGNDIFNRQVEEAVVEEVKKQVQIKSKASWGGIGLTTGGVGALVILRLFGINPATMEMSHVAESQYDRRLEQQVQAVEKTLDTHIALQLQENESTKEWRQNMLLELRLIKDKIYK